MSLRLPPLTREQFQQAAAWTMEPAHVSLGLRSACLALGFMSLDQLRTMLAKEEAEKQAAASTPTHDAALTAPVYAAATPSPARPAPPAEPIDTPAAAAARVIATLNRANGVKGASAAPAQAPAADMSARTESSPTPAGRLVMTAAQHAAAEGAVALFREVQSRAEAAGTSLADEDAMPTDANAAAARIVALLKADQSRGGSSAAVANRAVALFNRVTGENDA